MSEIAVRLRLARIQAGLSQGQVATMLGVHRPTISEIEAGRRRVAAEELLVFARIYAVSVIWLIGGEASASAVEDRLRPGASELAKHKPKT